MRIGCCVGLDRLETIRDAGFDFAELAVANVKAESPDGEYEPVRDLILDCGIVPEAWNCLLPGDMKVVGEEVDLYRVERYLRTAFERIEELRGEIVVFGSGRARGIPEGFSRDEARDQLVEFLTLAGQVAGAYGLTIAVEPLNRGECNVINSVPEAADLVRAVDHPFVKVLADIYHMTAEGEPIAAVEAAAGEIVHVHLSDSDRLYPGSGSYPIKELIALLKAGGYDDRLSIECSWREFEPECAKALEFLCRWS